MDPNAPRAARELALAAYVESLAVGRRVAVFGDASVGLGARIAELGARAVYVWDPDAERARQQAERAPHGVIVRAVPRDDVDMQRGSFDLVVVTDLELFDDADDLLARVRRLVGDEGVALVTAPSPDATGDPEAFDYYELFDLVAREFDEVTMIAQLPFYGVALAELREEEEDEPPTVTVDMQLAGADRTPEAYIALASQRGARLDPYAIVELPRPAAAASEVDAQARLRAAALEAQIEELQARLADADQTARVAQRLEQALRERSARVAQLEGALTDRTRELALLSEEAEQIRAAVEAQRVSVAEVEELALRAAGGERAERARAAAEVELARVMELHGAELARYEEGLRERAQAARHLEAELARREQMVRELVEALDDTAAASAAASGAGSAGLPPPLGAAPPDDEHVERDPLVEENARLREKLDALALDLARREGEAQASAWSIAELERRLEAASRGARDHSGQASPGERPTEPNPEPELKRHLASALDELDVLRRALAQEHEARLRAELRAESEGERPPPP